MSKALIDAAASYFGMDPEQLAQGTMSTNSEGLRFTFIVQVSDDDYLGIADRMRAMREPIEPEQDQATDWVQMPTVQEVMAQPEKYVGDPTYAEVFAHAARMSRKVRDVQKLYDEAAKQIEQVKSQPKTIDDVRKAEGLPTLAEVASQGVGGRAVKHVDVPAEEDSALPAAVWVRAEDTTQAQQQMASDYDIKDHRYLVQTAMLTPEQLAKVRS
jgi:hypothetical protein